MRNIKNGEAFENFCYYDLKTNLIIENYVTKVKSITKKVLLKFPTINTSDINFATFWQIFKEGNYGKIAIELAGSEDYVRSYFDYFKGKDGKLTENNLLHFMGLYYMEGELLVEEIHPTLSFFFKNEHNIAETKGCKVALAFWYLTDSLTKKIFVEFKWGDDKVIDREEIFTILVKTHSGKCWLMADKKCDFFDEILGKTLGFMNMSGGDREGLNVHETKLAYSTFLFNDICEETCKQKKFEAEALAKKIENIKTE
jgi:hypothetical protein